MGRAGAINNEVIQVGSDGEIRPLGFTVTGRPPLGTIDRNNRLYYEATPTSLTYIDVTDGTIFGISDVTATPSVLTAFSATRSTNHDGMNCIDAPPPIVVADPPVAVDDTDVMVVGQPATVDILDNDTDNDGLDPATVSFTLNQSPDGTTLSIDGRTLTVPGEGVWTIDPSNGAATFTPEGSFTGDPTPAGYVVRDTDGNGPNEATITLTVEAPAIGVVKAAAFNDENADGFAQVGETISYTYTVTNESLIDLSDVSLIETGFTGNGTTPVPVFIDGDTNNDDVLQPTETWSYEVDYALVAQDIDDGEVENSAEVEAEGPGGVTVSDISDSDNPADGDGTATPGEGPDNDDPTSTPLTNAPIVAQDDMLADPVDPATTQTNVLNVFADNGSGPDTLNGNPTDEDAAEVQVVLTAPPPPGITLNPDSSVDVAAGTAPGGYVFDYQICEILNPDNCNDATVSLTVGEGQIAVVKGAVFNDDVMPTAMAKWARPSATPTRSPTRAILI